MSSAFSSPARSLVKTIVMTTGEFEFDGLFFNNEDDPDELFYPEAAYIVWIVFLVLMPIILTNLLVNIVYFTSVTKLYNLAGVIK